MTLHRSAPPKVPPPPPPPLSQLGQISQKKYSMTNIVIHLFTKQNRVCLEATQAQYQVSLP